jgi:EAL domain-containing protein (putative c-di-GMP-specific phosphodiesterase class I)
MVVAEGVETPLQHEILKSIGCDFAQGYLFAKPKSESRVEEFLLRHKAKQSAEH